MKGLHKLFLLLLFVMVVLIAGFSANAFAVIDIPVSTPGEFTSPAGGDSFSGGEGIFVSWGSSTSNTLYGLEYSLSYYDGAQWISVTATDATSTTYLLPNTSTDQAKFRVFAQAMADEPGWRASEFRYSDVFCVTAVNTPPGAPSAFISPSGGELHEQGALIEIEWSGATDADGDVIGYELGFFDGNSWTVIRDLADPNNTQTMHNALLPAVVSAAAQFRVRAFDGADYSDYVYSNHFTIFQPMPTPTLTPAPTPVSTSTPVLTFTPRPTSTPTSEPTPAPTTSPKSTSKPEPTAASTQEPTPEPTAAPLIAPTLLPASQATQILPRQVPQSDTIKKSILSFSAAKMKCCYIFILAAILIFFLIIILVVRRKKKHKH